MPLFLDSKVAERVERLELDWNRYGVDPYGISKKELKRFYSLLNWLYQKYFNVTVTGIDQVPDTGRAMLVGNHSGGIALDAAMVVATLLMEKEPPRLAQGMADKFINRLPFASLYSQKLGHFTGLPEHAERLLERAATLDLALLMPKLGLPAEPAHVVASDRLDPWWRAVSTRERPVDPELVSSTS